MSPLHHYRLNVLYHSTVRLDLSDIRQLYSEGPGTVWCQLKKNTTWRLSFIGTLLRTIARQIAPHIALRNCSKEVVGKRSIYVILVKGEFNVIKQLSYKRFSASHKELMSPRRDLVIF